MLTCRQQLFVAGVEGVQQQVDFVDNVDVTNIVGTKHSNYHLLFPKLLELTRKFACLHALLCSPRRPIRTAHVAAKGQPKGRPSVGDIGARVRVINRGEGILHELSTGKPWLGWSGGAAHQPPIALQLLLPRPNQHSAA